MARSDVDEGAALSPLGFIFGGNTGLTAEELKKRRAIAAALAARQRGFPKNIGEGLTYLGESIGEAGLNWRLRQAEADALKYNQGLVRGGPGESTGQNPVVVARPAEETRPPVVVAEPPAARPVRTVPVRPSVAPPVTDTTATPLVDPKAPVTVDGGDPDAPAIVPRLEVTPDTPVVIEPTTPPVSTGPTTDSPPPFFEGRPNSQVSRPYPELAVPELGGTAAAARLRSNTPGPTPGGPAGGFSDRFGATAAPGSMPGEGEPVPYFDEAQTAGAAQSQLMATPAPLQRSDRLALPPGYDIRSQADLNEMDEAADAPVRAEGGTPAPGVPLPRPRPQVESYFNSIDQQGRYSPETVARWGGGIKGIESGGSRNPYASLGAVTRTGDRAYGAYQMMGRNIPAWTEAALGRRMTPQEFLRDQKAQDATFAHRFGQYVDKYGEEGAARAWYAGERGMRNLGATDQHGRLTVKSYGEDYLRRVGGAQQPEGEPTARITVRPQASQQAPQEVSQAPRTATVVGQPSRDDIAAALIAQQQMQGDGPREASQAFTDPQGQEVPQLNPTLAGANLPPEILTGASRPPARSSGTLVAEARGSRSQNPPIATDISPIPMAQRPAMGAPPVSSEMQRGPAVAPVPGVDPRAYEPIPETTTPPLTPPPPPPRPVDRLGPTPAQVHWDRVARDPRASDEVKAHAKAVIAREEKVREWQQKQLDTDYDYRRARSDKLLDDYNKQLRDAPKEALEQLATRLKIAKDQADLRQQPIVAAKAQADLEKVLRELAAPDRVTHGGEVYERTPAGQGQAPGEFRRPAGLPPVEKPLTETQSKDLRLYERSVVSNSQLTPERLRALGSAADVTARGVPWVGNYLVSPTFRAAKAAADAWLLSNIRLESGAVIGKEEIPQHYPTYFAMPGDDQKTLDQKEARRAAVMKSNYDALGSARPAADAFVADRTARRTQEPEGTIRTNRRTGQQQRVIDGYWENAGGQ